MVNGSRGRQDYPILSSKEEHMEYKVKVIVTRYEPPVGGERYVADRTVAELEIVTESEAVAMDVFEAAMKAYLKQEE